MSIRDNGNYASIKLTGYRRRFILCFVDDKGSEYFPLIKKGQEVRISHQKWSTFIVEFAGGNLTIDKEQLNGYRKNIFSNVPVILFLLVFTLFLIILLVRRPKIHFSTDEAKSSENQNKRMG